MNSPLDSNLEQAKRCLKIQAVKIRSSNFYINEGHRAESIVKLDLESESYRGAINMSWLEGVYGSDDDHTEARLIAFQYGVGARLMPKGYEDSPENPEKAKALVEIEAVFAAEYVSIEELSDDALHAFAKDHVGYHVWPYWREFVQSTATRMGVSPYLFSMPLYTISKEPE